MFNKKYSLSKHFGKKSKKHRRTSCKHIKKNTHKHRRNKKRVMKGG